MNNGTWLVFANESICNHTRSFHEIGIVSWVQRRNRFQIGDIIYFFMSDGRYVRFKAVVEAKDCQREDKQYWNIKAPDDITYRLRLIAEYEGEELNEDCLMKAGFKGGRSLQHPMKNNPSLFEYIQKIF
ncbi:MAG: hypothetical protein ACRCZY_09285 [Phocaeicola sp.]